MSLLVVLFVSQQAYADEQETPFQSLLNTQTYIQENARDQEGGDLQERS